MSGKGTKKVHREIHVYTRNTYTCIGRECIGCPEKMHTYAKARKCKRWIRKRNSGVVGGTDNARKWKVR